MGLINRLASRRRQPLTDINGALTEVGDLAKREDNYKSGGIISGISGLFVSALAAVPLVDIAKEFYYAAHESRGWLVVDESVHLTILTLLAGGTLLFGAYGLLKEAGIAVETYNSLPQNQYLLPALQQPQPVESQYQQPQPSLVDDILPVPAPQPGQQPYRQPPPPE